MTPASTLSASASTRSDAASASARSEVPLLRTVLGTQLRRYRQEQGRTLREVSRAAQVSLGYLSEIERGQKEPSSELLAAICEALAVPLSHVLLAASADVALHEVTGATVLAIPAAATDSAAA